MSKHLPKAKLKSFTDIQRETTVAPQVINVVPEYVETDIQEEVERGQPDTVLVRENAAPLRLTAARLIVERHTGYSALAGCLPLVVFDALSVGLVIFNMVRGLAAHYAIPFRQDQAKAVITALLGGILAPGMGSIVSHLVGKVLPGGWLFGVTASSATAAAYTKAAGEVFIAHFEAGGGLLDADLSGLREAFKAQMAH